MKKRIQSALISVYHKDKLEPVVKAMHEKGITIYSTGGTQQFIEKLGIPVVPVEKLTDYPSIFGGRVKTLHPKVFGGILHRRDNKKDQQEATRYEIPEIDLVIVDLYPFEQTVQEGAAEEEIIEKVDIGGISLIRAAAKNFHDVLIISSREQYDDLLLILTEQEASTDIEVRRHYAATAFDESSHYDTMIFHYFNNTLPEHLQILHYKESLRHSRYLRYGENPHQRGMFFGQLDDMFEQINGKPLSYNNLVDVDAAIGLIDEFPEAEGPAFAIIKHTNACGVATGKNIRQAYEKALQSDPVSAFGGVLVANTEIDQEAAELIDQLFFEVLIAPGYDKEARKTLKKKKNRIILERKNIQLPRFLYRTLLNGVLGQEKDLKTETVEDLKPATVRTPTKEEQKSMLFAAKIVKHTKSNTIVLAKDGQLFASGTGQTSRVDALRQAIHKAQSFGFDLSEAVMASDAFFPFPDCVEIAHEAGIRAVIQPGGSIKDQESVNFCDEHGMAMVMTGFRHFRH